MGPVRVLHVSAQSYGLRDQCCSCSCSSGENAAGREGWQFKGSIRWLLSSTFRAPCPLSRRNGRGIAHARRCEQAGPCFVRRHQSVVWLLKAQMVRQHRTRLEVDVIPSSAKVSSLPLTPSSLSVLPWTGCKTDKNTAFLPCFVCQAAAPRGKVLYCMLHRQHRAVLLVRAVRCCCSAIIKIPN